MKKMKTKSKKGKIVKIVVPVAVIAGVAGFVVFGKGSGNTAIPVYTSAVTVGDISSELSATGSVTADEVKTFFAPTDVKIEEVEVEKGDVVKAGDMLICFDEEAVAYAKQKNALEEAITNASYSANMTEYQTNKSDLTQAESDIASLEAQIDNYEIYIKQLTDGISNETAQKRAKLYEKIEGVQKQIADYELAIQTPDENTDITELQRKTTEKRNELTKLQDELSLLSDYKTADNWEDKLADAKKELEKLQTKLSEAKSKKSSAEAALVNNNKLSEYQLTKEKSALTSNDSDKKYAEAMNGIVAEFDGVVTEVSAVEGETPQEGARLAVLSRNDKVNVLFKATKFDLLSLEEGQPAVIDISGVKYNGKVTKINRIAEAGNNSSVPMVTVKVEVENPTDDIILGIEAKVVVTTASKEQVLVVPVEAINEDIDGKFCFVVDENSNLVKKYVTTGVYSDFYAEIVDGLNEGDVIATMSPMGMTLEDGMNVTAMQQ